MSDLVGTVRISVPAKDRGRPHSSFLTWFLLFPLSCFLLMVCLGSLAAASGPRNEMGDLVGLTARVDGREWEATLTRDVMGREVDRRLPGGGRSYIWRDALGRPTQQFVGQGETAHRLRRLSWSFDERLMSLFEQGRGETKFSYDGRGYLSKVEHPDGRETLRLPDEAGNLFGTPDGSDREYTRAGAVVRRRGAEGETVYRYDEEGNLSERRDPDGGVWRYHFRGDGKLRQVDRPDGTAVAFKYDALGRRVEKNWAGRVTRFVWAGDVVLHEWTCSGEAPQVQRSREEQSRYQAVERLRAQLHGHFGEDEGERRFRETLEGSEDPVHRAFLRALEEPEASEASEVSGEVVTWVFDPDGFAPMARMSASESLGLVSDHMSVPLVALDEQGAAVWQGFLDTRGQMEHEGDADLVPWRFAGQYHDPETGLHYNRHRYYDPEAEGFISPDPIGLAGGLRLYGYVEDPLGWIDPLGLAKQRKSGCEDDAARGGGSPANRALHEHYKDKLRAAMERPDVENPALSGILDDLYRPGASLGSGSTAAAVRHELATGQRVGGRLHSQKAADNVSRLQKWLERNPTARPGDRAAAENVLRDLQNALRGR